MVSKKQAFIDFDKGIEDALTIQIDTTWVQARPIMKTTNPIITLVISDLHPREASASGGIGFEGCHCCMAIALWYFRYI